MKGIGRKASFLALVAVMATALVGAAYTLWYENLTATVNVSTGHLDASIICGGTFDNDTNAGQWYLPIYPSPNPLKDIGHFTSQPGLTDNEWIIHLTNAYPGYAADCEYHFNNTGTVPWHVEFIDIAVTLPGDPTVYHGTCSLITGLCTWGDVAPTNPTLSPIYVQLSDDEGCQIHPTGQESGSLIIGVNQSALEASTYTIVVTFRLNQWNESGWSGCGSRSGPLVLPPPQ